MVINTNEGRQCNGRNSMVMSGILVLVLQDRIFGVGRYLSFGEHVTEFLKK